MKLRADPSSFAPDATAGYAGLELLSTAVLVVNFEARVRWVNQSAEAMVDVSRRILQGQLARCDVGPVRNAAAVDAAAAPAARTAAGARGGHRIAHR
jgi:nitrogen-specific signal transduction histidine kinase